MEVISQGRRRELVLMGKCPRCRCVVRFTKLDEEEKRIRVDNEGVRVARCPTTRCGGTIVAQLAWLSLVLLGLVFGGFSASAAPFTNGTYRVKLEWDASADALVTGYYAYCSTNAFWVGTNQVLQPVLVARVEAGTNLTCEVGGLAPGVRYWFVVTACSVDRIESDYSNQVGFAMAKAPGAPRLKAAMQMAAAGGAGFSEPWQVGDGLAGRGALLAAGAPQVRGVRMTSVGWPE
jgi:hypothetical protein